MSEAKKIPAALEAMHAEVGRLTNRARPCWKDEEVREAAAVKAEAIRNGDEAHFGYLFCDYSVICCAKMGDCFQVHVLGDPGVEMMPECNGCMSYKHNKTLVFEWFHFFNVFIQFVYFL